MLGWQWAVVGGLTAALVALPPVLARRPVDAPAIAPADLHALVMASATVPYSGEVTARGGLRLPPIRFLGEGLDLLGGRTRLRAWVAAPDRYRVDRLLAAGERGIYVDGDRRRTWVSEERRLVRQPVSAIDELRLARPDDLLPPDLARRFLAAARPDEVGPAAPRGAALQAGYLVVFLSAAWAGFSTRDVRS